MVEYFNKNFEFEDLIKSSNDRRFSAYGTVEVYDRHNELLPINEFYKSMDDYMGRGGLIMDNHTNKHIGKALNWTPCEKNGKPAIKITGEIFKSNRASDKVWKSMQSGEKEGISVGGSFEKSSETDEGKVLYGLEINEYSVVKRCGNQGATMVAMSMAKSESVEKQADDMKQTTTDESENDSESDDKLDELSEKITNLEAKVEELNQVVSGTPEKVEEIKKAEGAEPKKEEEESKTDDKPKDEPKKEESEEVKKSEFNIEDFAKNLTKKLDTLTSEILELKKSQSEKTEVLEVAKTEAPVMADVAKSETSQDIMKKLNAGEISKDEAMAKLRGNK